MIQMPSTLQLVRSVVTMMVLASAVLSLQAAEPATVDEATKVIDFSKFRLFGSEPQAEYQVVAGQGYIARGKIVDVARDIQRELAKQNWKELEGTAVTPEYASAAYARDGFVVSLSCMPGGEDGHVRIRLANLGNVDFKSLPLPRGSKEVHSSALMGMFQCDAKVDVVAKELRSSLTKQGWRPFGEVIGSFYMRKNAVKLMVSVDVAPGLDGKAVIQLSSEQLSCVIPLPENFENAQYDDSQMTMSFDSSQSQAELFSLYKPVLGKDGWKATTENAVRIDFRDHLIFRNPKRELIELAIHDFDGKTRCKVVFQTASNVEELDQLAKAAMDKAKKKREAEAQTPVPEARVKLAKGLKVVEQNERSVESSAPAGQSRKIVEAWLKEWEIEGWKVETVVTEDVVGKFELKRDNFELHLDYVDPGLVPAMISLSVFGKGKLVLAK